MKQQSKSTLVRIASIVAVAALVIGGFVAFTLADSSPRLVFSGARLQMVDVDGKPTIQALVDVSVANVEYVSGAEFSLIYNSDYLVPSDYETNRLISTANEIVYSEDFFTYNQNQDEFPFDPFAHTQATQLSNSVTPTLNQISVMVTGKVATSDEMDRLTGTEAFIAVPLAGEGEEDEDSFNYVIKAKDAEISLITLSFQITTEDKLSEMASLFDGTILPRGILTDGSGGYILKFDGDSAGVHGRHADKNGFYNLQDPYWLDDSDDFLDAEYRWNFDDMLVKAQSPRDGITVNAYQAYVNGNFGDLMYTLQRYSPSVHGTFTLGNDKAYTFPWGGSAYPEDEGARITVNGRTFRFRWNNDGDYSALGDEGISVADYTRGYQLWEITGTGDDIVETLITDENGIYDPTGGAYTVSQIFYYYHNQKVETFSLPIEHTVTVTPVTAVSLLADDEALSWVTGSEDLPSVYRELHLPQQVRIGTDVLTGNNDFYLPVQYYDYRTLDTLQGAGENGTVNWIDYADEANVGVYTLTAVPRFTGTAIQSAYPWMTVSGDWDGTLSVERTILPLGAAANPTGTGNPSYYVVASESYRDDLNTARAYFTIYKYKDSAGFDPEDMDQILFESLSATGVEFRLRLPNGVVVSGSDFTNATDASFTPQSLAAPLPMGQPDATVRSYGLQVIPGSNTSGEHMETRELVRRSINLGGYFAVSVKNGADDEFSEFIPVYVAPRNNYHQISYTTQQINDPGANEDYLFDFTGYKKALFPHYQSPLNQTVTLPDGYGVAVRYDGETGREPTAASPVVMRTFRVNNGVWRMEQNGTEYTYGEDSFDNYRYATFGYVQNATTSGWEFRNRQVIIRTEIYGNGSPAEENPQPTEPPAVDFAITYEGTADQVLLHDDGQAERVIFTSRTEGYTTRQEVELTITNTGDIPITGLYLDLNENDPFTIVRPPASDIPVGGKTTFKVSYVYGLDIHAPDPESTPEAPYQTYATDMDDAHLHIWAGTSSNGRVKSVDAEIRIVETPIYRVEVVQVERDQSGGTSAVVIGKVGDTFEPGPAANGYLAGESAYILAIPDENSEIKEVYYYLDNIEQPENKEILELGNAALGITEEGWHGYELVMPSHDVIVYVVLQETMESLLRLEDLKPYAQTQMLSDGITERPKEQYQDYSGEMYDPSSYAEISFDPETKSYMVVVDATYDSGYLWFKLREDLQTGYPDIYPYVTVNTKHFGAGTGADSNVHEYPRPGEVDENNPYKYIQSSGTISIPEPRDYRVATLTISARDTRGLPEDATEDEINNLDEITVSYTVKFIRRSAGDRVVHTLAYGNSPYGLIAGSANIPEVNKTGDNNAYDVFDAGSRFDASNQEYWPIKATGLNLIYWQEAWGDGVNYDKDTQALFAYLGEPFDDPGFPKIVNYDGNTVYQIFNSAGDPVALADVTRTVEGLVVLDDATQEQTEQFVGVPLGESLALGSSETSRVPAGWSGEDSEALRILPGVYTLRYTFEDFDGESKYMERPMIILSPLGDVAVLGSRQENVNLVKNRVASPLGYECTNYLYASLFQYRIVDANNDRNINNIDANTIANSADYGRYYHTTNYQD